MIAYQLNFFKDPETCRFEAIEEMVEKNYNSQERVRRGLFARHGDLEKKYDELRHEFEQLKQAICKADR
jgi:hypothetical protein